MCKHNRVLLLSRERFAQKFQIPLLILSIFNLLRAAMWAKASDGKSLLEIWKPENIFNQKLTVLFKSTLSKEPLPDLNDEHKTQILPVAERTTS